MNSFERARLLLTEFKTIECCKEGDERGDVGGDGVGDKREGGFGEGSGDESCCRCRDGGGLGKTSLGGRNVGGEATILISGLEGTDKESEIVGDESSLDSPV